MEQLQRPRLSASEQKVFNHLQARLVASSKEKACGDQLIVEHHDLKDAALVREQLRYAATYLGPW